MNSSTNYTHGQQVQLWDRDGQHYRTATINRQVEQLGDRTMPKGKVHVDRYRRSSISPLFSKWVTELVDVSRVVVM